MKALNIVDTAYRATLEEQDDTVLWISQAMKNAGADLDVLLRANAVNYAVRGQDASGLRFGSERQTQPPHLDQDLLRLEEKGVRVMVVEEDLMERGLDTETLVPGLERVHRNQLAQLFSGYDQVWQW